MAWQAPAGAVGGLQSTPRRPLPPTPQIAPPAVGPSLSSTLQGQPGLEARWVPAGSSERSHLNGMHEEGFALPPSSPPPDDTGSTAWSAEPRSPVLGPPLPAMEGQDNAHASRIRTSESAGAQAWAETVPREVLETLSKKEIARQNEIYELIQKEQEYLADLDLLQTLFLPGLTLPNAAGDPPPLPLGEYQTQFVAEVFGNCREVQGHASTFLSQLERRQEAEQPLMSAVGDICLDAALEWGGAYATYVCNYPIARSRVKRELAINPRFAFFVEAARKEPQCRRLTFEHFLFRPSPRLQRIRLQLQEVLKHTEDSHHDHAAITQAISVMSEQLSACDAGMVAAEERARIREYAYTFERLPQASALELLHPERRIIFEGHMYRKPDAFDFEWQECRVILFDNAFLVIKEDPVSGAFQSFSRRPIPVELLDVVSVQEPPLARSAGLGTLNLRSTERAESREAWPILLRHAASAEVLALHTATEAQRVQWRDKLNLAIAERRQALDSRKLFILQQVYEGAAPMPLQHAPHVESHSQDLNRDRFHVKVTCAVPLTTDDGRHLIAVGCADGVFIGLRHDPQSLRKVLHLKQVTQCAALEAYGIFVVLADNVLISYSMEALVPTSKQASASTRPPQKLSGNRDVAFFHVGVLKGVGPLLVYMKKKASESVFRVLEPIPAGRSSEKGSSSFFRKFKDQKSSDWFCVYKTFFIPSEAFALQFLRSKLCIICAKGFEIMALESLLPGTVPDFSLCPRDDTNVLSLMKKIDHAKALRMFKLDENEFLLCYDRFGCYVDRLGNPTRGATSFSWEGRPSHVAWVNPWVVAFDRAFVEIRHASSGALVQIIRGVNVRDVSGESIGRRPDAGLTQTIMVAQSIPVEGGRRFTETVFELTLDGQSFVA